MKEVSTGFIPRPGQLELSKMVKRFSACACHRRWGKSIFFINYTLFQGLRCPLSNPQYAFISPLLSQSKRNLWDPLKKYTANFPHVDVNESELRVDIWRSKDDRIRISLFGADNPNSIAGYYADGVVMDEAQDHEPSFFGPIIRPLLSDRRGWAHWFGTARGKNYFWNIRKRYEQKMLAGDPDYFSITLKASDTGVIPEKELLGAKEDMGEEMFLQEYELNVDTPVKGSYYGAYLEQAEAQGRICVVPYEPALPVDLSFDLGMDDTTAIWFIQSLNRQFRVIDYDEDSGLGIPEWAGRLRLKPYQYGTIYLPHDAKVKELGTGKSREEIFRLQRFHPRVTPRQAVADGIQAVRTIIPRSWFDREKCKIGLDALRSYQREWDDKEKVFRTTPKHDWSSHSADSMRTFAMGIREEREAVSDQDREADTDYDFTDY